MNHSVDTPPGPSPNSPSLLFEYIVYKEKRQIYEIGESNRKNRFGSENRIEDFFGPNWNALLDSVAIISIYRYAIMIILKNKKNNKTTAVFMGRKLL